MPPRSVAGLQRRAAAAHVRQHCLRVASACSGLCTESFALRRMGVAHRLVMTCEIDRKLRRFIKKNHAPAVQLRDIKHKSFLLHGATAHLFVAGFPCQSFSGCGEGHGLRDPRGGAIIDAIISWLARNQPSCFMLENVSGLVTRHRADFERILKRLTQLKDPATGALTYRICWEILNSRNFGVPQARSDTTSGN